MGIAPVQMPKKSSGGGFFDILGNVFKIGGAVASLVGTAGASAPLTVPQLASTGASVAGGVQSAGNLVSGPDKQVNPIEPPKSNPISESSMQELTNPSKYLIEARDEAMKIPEYKDIIPTFNEAINRAQRKDYLAMRRGGY